MVVDLLLNRPCLVFRRRLVDLRGATQPERIETEGVSLQVGHALLLRVDLQEVVRSQFLNDGLADDVVDKELVLGRVVVLLVEKAEEVQVTAGSDHALELEENVGVAVFSKLCFLTFLFLKKLSEPGLFI